MKNSTKKELSAKVILIVAIVSYSLKFLIGGIIGDSFALLGFICLILGLMRLVKEIKEKKMLKNENDNQMKKESIKKNINFSQISITIIALTTLSLIFFSFVINIGINNLYFIKRDFNTAFNYRMSGDCESYSEYTFDKKESLKSCEDDKKFKHDDQEVLARKIIGFKLQNITNKGNSDTAFLQVEYTMNNFLSGDGGDKRLTSFFVSKNIIMKKDGLTWKIK